MWVRISRHGEGYFLPPSLAEKGVWGLGPETIGRPIGRPKILAAIHAGADMIQADSLDILLPLLRARDLHD